MSRPYRRSLCVVSTKQGQLRCWAEYTERTGTRSGISAATDGRGDMILAVTSATSFDWMRSVLHEKAAEPLAPCAIARINPRTLKASVSRSDETFTFYVGTPTPTTSPRALRAADGKSVYDLCDANDVAGLIKLLSATNFRHHETMWQHRDTAETALMRATQQPTAKLVRLLLQCPQLCRPAYLNLTNRARQSALDLARRHPKPRVQRTLIRLLTCKVPIPRYTFSAVTASETSVAGRQTVLMVSDAPSAEAVAAAVPDPPSNEKFVYIVPSVNDAVNKDSTAAKLKALLPGTHHYVSAPHTDNCDLVWVYKDRHATFASLADAHMPNLAETGRLLIEFKLDRETRAVERIRSESKLPLRLLTADNVASFLTYLIAKPNFDSKGKTDATAVINQLSEIVASGPGSTPEPDWTTIKPLYTTWRKTWRVRDDAAGAGARQINRAYPKTCIATALNRTTVAVDRVHGWGGMTTVGACFTNAGSLRVLVLSTTGAGSIKLPKIGVAISTKLCDSTATLPKGKFDVIVIGSNFTWDMVEAIPKKLAPTGVVFAPYNGYDERLLFMQAFGTEKYLSTLPAKRGIKTPIDVFITPLTLSDATMSTLLAAMPDYTKPGITFTEGTNLTLPSMKISSEIFDRWLAENIPHHGAFGTDYQQTGDSYRVYKFPADLQGHKEFVPQYPFAVPVGTYGNYRKWRSDQHGLMWLQQMSNGRNFAAFSLYDNLKLDLSPLITELQDSYEIPSRNLAQLHHAFLVKIHPATLGQRLTDEPSLYDTLRAQFPAVERLRQAYVNGYVHTLVGNPPA